MNDASVVAIVTVIGTVTTTFLTGIVTVLLARQKAKTEDVAKKLESSDSRTMKSLNDISVVAAATHALVNSASLVQLRLNAILSKRIADFPGATDEDKEAARVASDLYQEHKKNQEEVDRFPSVNQAMKDITSKM